MTQILELINFKEHSLSKVVMKFYDSKKKMTFLINKIEYVQI